VTLQQEAHAEARRENGEWGMKNGEMGKARIHRAAMRRGGVLTARF